MRKTGSEAVSLQGFQMRFKAAYIEAILVETRWVKFAQTNQDADLKKPCPENLK